MTMKETYFLARLRAKGQITLPAAVRSLLNLKEGDELTFYVNKEGRIIVDKLHTIHPDQVWFWSERWQNMERKAQADIEDGRVTRYANADEAIKALEELAHARNSND